MGLQKYMLQPSNIPLKARFSNAMQRSGSMRHYTEEPRNVQRNVPLNDIKMDTSVAMGSVKSVPENENDKLDTYIDDLYDKEKDHFGNDEKPYQSNNEHVYNQKGNQNLEALFPHHPIDSPPHNHIDSPSDMLPHSPVDKSLASIGGTSIYNDDPSQVDKNYEEYADSHNSISEDGAFPDIESEDVHDTHHNSLNENKESHSNGKEEKNGEYGDSHRDSSSFTMGKEQKDNGYVDSHRDSSSVNMGKEEKNSEYGDSHTDSSSFNMGKEEKDGDYDDSHRDSSSVNMEKDEKNSEYDGSHKDSSSDNTEKEDKVLDNLFTGSNQDSPSAEQENLDKPQKGTSNAHQKSTLDNQGKYDDYDEPHNSQDTSSDEKFDHNTQDTSSDEKFDMTQNYGKEDDLLKETARDEGSDDLHTARDEGNDDLHKEAAKDVGSEKDDLHEEAAEERKQTSDILKNIQKGVEGPEEDFINKITSKISKDTLKKNEVPLSKLNHKKDRRAEIIRHYTVHGELLPDSTDVKFSEKALENTHLVRKAGKIEGNRQYKYYGSYIPDQEFNEGQERSLDMSVNDIGDLRSYEKTKATEIPVGDLRSYEKTKATEIPVGDLRSYQTTKATEIPVGDLRSYQTTKAAEIPVGDLRSYQTTKAAEIPVGDLRSYEKTKATEIPVGDLRSYQTTKAAEIPVGDLRSYQTTKAAEIPVGDLRSYQTTKAAEIPVGDLRSYEKTKATEIPDNSGHHHPLLLDNASTNYKNFDNLLHGIEKMLEKDFDRATNRSFFQRSETKERKEIQVHLNKDSNSKLRKLKEALIYMSPEDIRRTLSHSEYQYVRNLIAYADPALGGESKSNFENVASNTNLPYTDPSNKHITSLELLNFIKSFIEHQNNAKRRSWYDDFLKEGPEKLEPGETYYPLNDIETDEHDIADTEAKVMQKILDTGPIGQTTISELKHVYHTKKSKHKTKNKKKLNTTVTNGNATVTNGDLRYINLEKALQDMDGENISNVSSYNQSSIDKLTPKIEDISVSTDNESKGKDTEYKPLQYTIEGTNRHSENSEPVPIFNPHVPPEAGTSHGGASKEEPYLQDKAMENAIHEHPPSTVSHAPSTPMNDEQEDKSLNYTPVDSTELARQIHDLIEKIKEEKTKYMAPPPKSKAAHNLPVESKGEELDPVIATLLKKLKGHVALPLSPPSLSKPSKPVVASKPDPTALDQYVTPDGAVPAGSSSSLLAGYAVSDSPNSFVLSGNGVKKPTLIIPAASNSALNSVSGSSPGGTDPAESTAPSSPDSTGAAKIVSSGLPVFNIPLSQSASIMPPQYFRPPPSKQGPNPYEVLTSDMLFPENYFTVKETVNRKKPMRTPAEPAEENASHYSIIEQIQKQALEEIEKRRFAERLKKKPYIKYKPLPVVFHYNGKEHGMNVQEWDGVDYYNNAHPNKKNKNKKGRKKEKLKKGPKFNKNTLNFRTHADKNVKNNNGRENGKLKKGEKFNKNTLNFKTRANKNVRNNNGNGREKGKLKKQEEFDRYKPDVTHYKNGELKTDLPNDYAIGTLKSSNEDNYDADEGKAQDIDNKISKGNNAADEQNNDDEGYDDDDDDDDYVDNGSGIEKDELVDFSDDVTPDQDDDDDDVVVDNGSGTERDELVDFSDDVTPDQDDDDDVVVNNGSGTEKDEIVDFSDDVTPDQETEEELINVADFNGSKQKLKQHSNKKTKPSSGRVSHNTAKSVLSYPYSSLKSLKSDNYDHKETIFTGTGPISPVIDDTGVHSTYEGEFTPIAADIGNVGWDNEVDGQRRYTASIGKLMRKDETDVNPQKRFNLNSYSLEDGKKFFLHFPRIGKSVSNDWFKEKREYDGEVTAADVGNVGAADVGNVGVDNTVDGQNIDKLMQKDENYETGVDPQKRFNLNSYSLEDGKKFFLNFPRIGRSVSNDWSKEISEYDGDHGAADKDMNTIEEGTKFFSQFPRIGESISNSEDEGEVDDLLGTKVITEDNDWTRHGSRREKNQDDIGQTVIVSKINKKPKILSPDAPKPKPVPSNGISNVDHSPDISNVGHSSDLKPSQITPNEKAIEASKNKKKPKKPLSPDASSHVQSTGTSNEDYISELTPSAPISQPNNVARADSSKEAVVPEYIKPAPPPSGPNPYEVLTSDQLFPGEL